MSSEKLPVIDIVNRMPKHPTKTYPRRDLGDISHIDMHHSATLTSDYRGLSTIEGFANFHINTHGWAGIGYHYILTPDLKIYKTGYDSQSRWSVGNHNGYTISSLIIGDYSQEEISLDLYNLAIKWINYKKRAYAVPVVNIKGHNEYPGHASNTCPGINMTQFREDVDNEG